MISYKECQIRGEKSILIIKPSPMDIESHILVSDISLSESTKLCGKYHSIIWIKDEVDEFFLDEYSYHHLANTLIFIDSTHGWKIFRKNDGIIAGYVLCFDETIMNEPFLNNIRIHSISAFYAHKFSLFHIDPVLGARLQSIVDMLVELLKSRLNHKEIAILGLINTFFVYCDEFGLAKYDERNPDSRMVLVRKFLELISNNITEVQRVEQYAHLMNISSSYLNECTHDIMEVSAKSLIIGQLVMEVKNKLRFTEKTIKEIAYELGFSSPDYFSSFCKKHIGQSPTEYRHVS